MDYFEFPPGCRARGRNGNFNPASVRISHIDAQRAVISIFSNSEGPTAPIWISGDPSQLGRLLRDISTRLLGGEDAP